MKTKIPNISFTKVRKLILVFLTILGIFSSGYLIGIKGYKINFGKSAKTIISRELPKDKTGVNFSLFWKVWDILEGGYFDKAKINYKEMVYGAIQGMVSALGDPYTTFLPPEENKVIEEDLSGSFEGIGIQIGYKGTQLAVITPLPNSPALKSGIKAGDFIVGIKDEVKKIDRGTVGISLQEAVQIIRGPAGSKVTLALLRDKAGEQVVVDVTREKVNVPTLVLEYVGKDKSIAHVQLLRFGKETNSEWQKTVSQILKKENVKSIILDLRGNPGGYMDEAVDIASEFVKNNSTIVIEERAGGYKKEYKTQRLGLLTEVPLVVLVNGGSASASEILAGALKDIKKVKIVGEKTFGKGTIQEPQQLEGGEGLHITVARWLTPTGIWVNEKGLEPDVKIEDDLKTTLDEQLQKAIELLERQYYGKVNIEN